MQAGTLLGVRRRIRSVKSTQQITKAMEMVSAARLRKVERSTFAMRPYGQEFDRIIAGILPNLEGDESPLIERRSRVNAVGFVVMGADRGLCGAFNTNIVRYTEKLMAEVGVPVRVIACGRKMVRHFRKTHKLDGAFEEIFRSVSISLAEAIARKAVELYETARVDEVQLVYVRFVNVVRHQVDRRVLLPISLDEVREEIKEELGPEALGEISYAETFPDAATVAGYVFQRYIALVTFRCLLETLTSEMGARMSVMKQATENAGEMIDHLTLIYNQARQRSITRELLDIVGAAEALKG